MFSLRVLSMTAMLMFSSAVTLAQETSMDLRKDGRIVTGDRKDFFLRKVATNEYKVSDHLRNKFKSSAVSAIVIPPDKTDGKYLIGVVLGGVTLPDDWLVTEEEFRLLRAFAVNKKLAKAEAATQGVRDGFASGSHAMVNANTAELESLMAENSSESKVAVAYAGYLLLNIDKAGEIASLSDIVARYKESETMARVPTPDDVYAIIEYPLQKEIKIYLTPVGIDGAKGVATILRANDGTRIKLNLTNVPADLTALTLYTVDQRGGISPLGPITISNGTGILAATTPLSTFMLIAAPQYLSAEYDRSTKVFFRSVAPEGFAVISMNGPSGEKVGIKVDPVGPIATTYTAPMLNIPTFKKGDDTKIKVDFTGALSGPRANVFVTPRKDGSSEIMMRFYDLKEAPAGQKIIVWAVGANGEFQKLGQVVNVPGSKVAEFKSETTLADFGLVVTMESADADLPSGPTVAHVHIVP